MAGIYRHERLDDVLLWLLVLDPVTREPVTGLSPELQLRRIREAQGGAALDGHWWNGDDPPTFVAADPGLVLVERDAVNEPGYYDLLFPQSKLATGVVYRARFHADDGAGYEYGVDYELHVFGPVSDIVPTALGSPLRSIVIHVDDDQPVPVPSMLLDIFDAGDTAFITRGTTDAGGDFALSLPDATYSVRGYAPGHGFVTQQIVVTADETFNLDATRLLPAAPSSPELCVISGPLRDSAGVVHANTTFEVWAVTPQAVAGAQRTNRITYVTSDDNGVVSFELERLVQVRLVCPPAGLDVTRTVPDLDSQDLATWA